MAQAARKPFMVFLMRSSNTYRHHIRLDVLNRFCSQRPRLGHCCTTDVSARVSARIRLLFRGTAWRSAASAVASSPQLHACGPAV